MRLARQMGISLKRDTVLRMEDSHRLRELNGSERQSKSAEYPVIVIRTSRDLTPFWDALRNEVPDYWDRGETG